MAAIDAFDLLARGRVDRRRFLIGAVALGATVAGARPVIAGLRALHLPATPETPAAPPAWDAAEWRSVVAAVAAGRNPGAAVAALTPPVFGAS